MQRILSRGTDIEFGSSRWQRKSEGSEFWIACICCRDEESRPMYLELSLYLPSQSDYSQRLSLFSIFPVRSRVVMSRVILAGIIRSADLPKAEMWCEKGLGDLWLEGG